LYSARIQVDSVNRFEKSWLTMFILMNAADNSWDISFCQELYENRVAYSLLNLKNKQAAVVIFLIGFRYAD